eukprot:scaffold7494_cov55-Attheya_sp.AAC.9
MSLYFCEGKAVRGNSGHKRLPRGHASTSALTFACPCGQENSVDDYCNVLRKFAKNNPIVNLLSDPYVECQK